MMTLNTRHAEEENYYIIGHAFAVRRKIFTTFPSFSEDRFFSTRTWLGIGVLARVYVRHRLLARERFWNTVGLLALWGIDYEP